MHDIMSGLTDTKHEADNSTRTIPVSVCQINTTKKQRQEPVGFVIIGKTDKQNVPWFLTNVINSRLGHLTTTCIAVITVTVFVSLWSQY